MTKRLHSEPSFKRKMTANRIKVAAKLVPSEHAEQVAVIQWCNLHPIAKHIFAIPNGILKNAAAHNKMKREGFRPGLPDLCLDVPRDSFHGLRIEMKRIKGSTTSAEQKAWGKFYAEQGYYWCICKGADEAIRVIKEYLEL